MMTPAAMALMLASTLTDGIPSVVTGALAVFVLALHWWAQTPDPPTREDDVQRILREVAAEDEEGWR